jgi:hypothetical protein
VARLNIRVRGCGEAKLLTSWQQRSREREGERKREGREREGEKVKGRRGSGSNVPLKGMPPQ